MELLLDLLFDTISFHDYAESFYHAFVTGLVASAGCPIMKMGLAGQTL